MEGKATDAALWTQHQLTQLWFAKIASRLGPTRVMPPIKTGIHKAPVFVMTLSPLMRGAMLISRQSLMDILVRENASCSQ